MIGFDRSPTGGLLLLLAVALFNGAAATRPAHAQAQEHELGFDLDGLHVGLGGRAGLSYIKTGHTNFGAGVDVGLDGSVDHNVDYAEGFVQPRIDLSYKTESFGEFYSAASVIGAATRLNGDPGNFTFDDPADIDLGHAYAGWKSGELLSGLGTDALTLSVGRQDFHLGDGFMIWDGNFETAGDATYWIAPRTFQ